MDEKLRKAMAEAFEMKEEELNDGSSMENTEKWDSLSHMKLVIDLEKRFGVKFDENDIMRMTSAKEISEVLKEKGAV